MVYWSLYILLGTGNDIIKANGGKKNKKIHTKDYFFSFSAKHKKKKNGLVFNSKCFQFFNVRSTFVPICIEPGENAESITITCLKTTGLSLCESGEMQIIGQWTLVQLDPTWPGGLGGALTFTGAPGDKRSSNSSMLPWSLSIRSPVNSQEARAASAEKQCREAASACTSIISRRQETTPRGAGASPDALTMEQAQSIKSVILIL